MIVELKKQANDLAQNVYHNLQNAVMAASTGGDYSEDWERAMQNQTELLAVINNLKYKQSQKPRSTPNESQGTNYDGMS